MRVGGEEPGDGRTSLFYLFYFFMLASLHPPSSIEKKGASYLITESGEGIRQVQLSPLLAVLGRARLLEAHPPCSSRVGIYRPGPLAGSRHTWKSSERKRVTAIQGCCVNKPTELLGLKPILHPDLDLQMPDCCITFNWFLFDFIFLLKYS